ncbi:MAG: DUF2155 domain-containing protein [Pikeienuella sp.]
MKRLMLLALMPFMAFAQQAEDDTGDLRDRFIKPPEGVEFNDEYVEEVIEVERPDSRSVARQVALLRGLDKISGRVSDIRIPVGEAVTYERLTIRVDHCRTPPDDEADDAFAYMRIQDSKTGNAEVFVGWMFASSPALNAMDHQRYDVWVLNCTTS